MNAWDDRARRTAATTEELQLEPGRTTLRPPLREWRPRILVAAIREFYAEPGSWLALATCSLVLTYGGGALMFWFHAIYLGEGGPAISPWLHWLLDSTAGFVGLTPAIALILPVAAWLATPTGSRPRTPRSTFARRALLGGGLLAVVTAPAPLLHDALIGRGTWLADHVTDLLGNGPRPRSEHQHVPALVEMARQVGFGVPTYVVLTAIALLAVGVTRTGSSWSR
ncbi:MAG: hypothetical protein ACRD2C_10090 [Acidimicrobiales bacterium]